MKTSFFALSIALLSTSCVQLRKSCYEGTYPGLRQCLSEVRANGGTLRIIAIHGMGNHCTNWSNKVTQPLFAQLPVQRQCDDELFALPTSIATNFLKTYSFLGAGAQVIKVYEVTWTPSTVNLKNEMFSKDRLLDADRVKINKSLKNKTINEGFGDAVLYLNPSYKEAMQKPIEDSIERLVRDGLQTNDQIILISASLRSKMTFDTVNKHLQTNTASSILSVNVQNFAARTTRIIMLANQLPLLTLGDEAYDPFTRGIQESTKLPKRFGGVEGFIEAKRKDPKENKILQSITNFDPLKCPIQIIAVTDPNDLLSYPVEKSKLVPTNPSDTNLVNVQNVYVHSAPAILGLFVWPSAAHNGHPKNAKFVKKLTSGWTNEVECFPKPISSVDPYLK